MRVTRRYGVDYHDHASNSGFHGRGPVICRTPDGIVFEMVDGPPERFEPVDFAGKVCDNSSWSCGSASCFWAGRGRQKREEPWWE